MDSKTDRTSPVFEVFRVQSWTRFLIAVVLAIAAARWMAPFLVPTVFAIFLAVLFAPLDRRLCKVLPDKLRWVGQVVSLVILLVVIALFMGAIGYSATQLAEEVPRIAERLSERFPSMMPGEGEEAPAPEGFPGSLEEAGALIGQWLVGAASTAAKATVSALGASSVALVLIVFMTLLFLGERPVWMKKVDAVFDENGRQAWRTALNETIVRLRRFLAVRAVVGVINAGAYVAWLWVFDLRLLLVWGVLTFALNFIPNIGSVIAGVLPTLFAFAVLDPWTAFLVGAGLFLIEQVIGNLIDPKLQGRQIVMSPSVILVSLVFWSWLWGAPGAFLATPMTLTILVLTAHIPPLRPVALALSNQPDLGALDRSLGQGPSSG